MFQDKRILVTGGTGSMGKTFVRRGKIRVDSQGPPEKIDCDVEPALCCHDSP